MVSEILLPKIGNNIAFSYLSLSCPSDRRWRCTTRFLVVAYVAPLSEGSGANTATCIADRSLPPCWRWWVELLVSAHTICFCHINMLLFKCCQSFIAKYTPINSVPGRFLTSGERDHLQDRGFSLDQQFAPEVAVNTIIVKDFDNFSRRPNFPKLTKNKSGHHWRNFKISLNFAGVIFIESLLENEIFRMVAGEWGQEENRTSYRPIQVQLSCSISFNVLANHFARKANEGMLRYLAHSLFVSVFSYCQG